MTDSNRADRQGSRNFLFCRGEMTVSVQIKLIRCDHRTGRVLDENYVLLSFGPPESRIMNTFFDSLDDAITYINANKSQHTNVEFHVISDDKQIYQDVSDHLDFTTELYLTPNFQRNRPYFRNEHPNDGMLIKLLSTLRRMFG